MNAIAITAKKTYRKVVDQWQNLPPTCSEADLEMRLMALMWAELGIGVQQIRKTPTIGSGLIPDYLIYGDLDQPPILVVEDKKRVPELAATPAEKLADHTLYKNAVGHQDCSGNGIRQYLDKDKVKPDCLASFGLVFNGDFFQLWRRVDGLVMPLTAVQKVTKTSLPHLMRQLAYCLSNPHNALVASVWNQKGGVAKTTNIINIGATLALQGRRVLMIDLDPQGDLSRGLGLNEKDRTNCLESFSAKFQLEEMETAKSILGLAIQSKTFPTTDKRSYTLSVLADLKASLEKFRDSSTVLPVTAFRGLIKLLKKDYDYIFVDVSPTPDKLTYSVLYSCDTVLIPVDFGGKSLHHAIQLYNQSIPQIRSQRAKQEQLHLGPWNLGVVFSNCPADVGSQLKKCIEDELTKNSFAGKRYQTQLQTYAQAKIAEFKHVPVVCWQNSPITDLYNKLVHEVFLNHNFTDH